MSRYTVRYRYIFGLRFVSGWIGVFFLCLSLSGSQADTTGLRLTGESESSQRVSAFPEEEFEEWLPFGRRYIHRVSAELRPGRVVPSNAFLRGHNYQNRSIDESYTAHLKYAFQFRPGSREGRLYGLPYQGIGFSVNTFENREELGDPWSFYLFQGARILALSPSLSVNYEWNLGLSWGWQPFDMYYNSYNYSIGSRINAYLNADFYLNWMVTRQMDVFAGVSLSHFSNGNTKLPNSGVNVVAAKVGAAYYFNRDYDRYFPTTAIDRNYTRSMSYDLLLFGAWRSKGLKVEDGILPYSIKTFGVAGASFSALYNLSRRIKVGGALDAIYDGSANVVYREDYSSSEGIRYVTPPVHEQMALGVSARLDYAMPFFTVSLGLGYDFIHAGTDLKSFYQMLALKIDMTRSTYLNIGYRLKNFETPNFLMLGVGFRFRHSQP